MVVRSHAEGKQMYPDDSLTLLWTCSAQINMMQVHNKGWSSEVYFPPAALITAMRFAGFGQLYIILKTCAFQIAILPTWRRLGIMEVLDYLKLELTVRSVRGGTWFFANEPIVP